jgi:hypothetical protein
MKIINRSTFIAIASLAISISVILGFITNLIPDALFGKYKLIIYGAIIVFSVIGLGIFVLQFIGDWLTQRHGASITLEAGDRKIVAENITSKDAAKLVELFQSLQEGHFSFENDEVSNEGNKDIRSEESNSPGAIPDRSVGKEASKEQPIYIITFDNVSPLEASRYAEELRGVLLDNLSMSRVELGRSDHYSQDLGNTLILVLNAPEIFAAVTAIQNWLRLRKGVSLTIETPDHKVNIHNIDAASVARLNEIFLSQQ